MKITIVKKNGQSVILGETNNTKVYLGTDELDREVAVKVLNIDYNFESSFSSIILDEEGKSTAKAIHRNIVKIFSIEDVEIDDSKVKCLIFERIDGETLCEFLKKDKYEEEELYNIGKQLIEACMFLVEKNLFTFDLHEENIMISADGILKIIDLDQSFSKYLDNITIDTIRENIEKVLLKILDKTKYSEHMKKRFYDEISFILETNKKDDVLNCILAVYDNIMTYVRFDFQMKFFLKNDDEVLKNLNHFKFRSDWISNFSEFRQRLTKFSHIILHTTINTDFELEVITDHSLMEIRTVFLMMEDMDKADKTINYFNLYDDDLKNLSFTESSHQTNDDDEEQKDFSLFQDLMTEMLKASLAGDITRKIILHFEETYFNKYGISIREKIGKILIEEIKIIRKAYENKNIEHEDFIKLLEDSKNKVEREIEKIFIDDTSIEFFSK